MKLNKTLKKLINEYGAEEVTRKLYKLKTTNPCGHHRPCAYDSDGDPLWLKTPNSKQYWDTV